MARDEQMVNRGLEPLGGPLKGPLGQKNSQNCTKIEKILDLDLSVIPIMCSGICTGLLQKIKTPGGLLKDPKGPQNGKISSYVLFCFLIHFTMTLL